MEADLYTGPTMALLERSAFHADLLGGLESAARGEGRLVLLAGEAGIGKTVFARSFCDAVESRARVLAGACDPLSTPRPLEPLLDIAGALGGELEHLLRASDRRGEAFRTFLRLLERPARPAVVIFEDVHWADEATLDLLRFLGRRIGGTHALLIATYRDDEVGPKHPLRAVAGDLATSQHVQRLQLPPLSAEAVARLAAGTGLDATDLHRKTGGNPFFVTEVLAAGTTGVPATVRDAVLARVARLPLAARSVLEAAAVIGARLEPKLLEAVLGPTIGALDTCLASGILQARGELYAFRHELAREALIETISPLRRVELHQRVLAALRASPTGPDDLARLAHHAEAARDGVAVLEYAPEAARRAAGLGAHREAAEQYARALRFAADLPPAERARLLEGHAWECHLTDQLAAAIASRRAAIDLWRQLRDPFKEGENLARLAHSLVLAGQNAEGEEASRKALEVLELHPPSPQLALAYRFQSYLRMLNRDNDEAVAWGERAIALAERFDDVETLAHTYNSIGSALIVADEVERGRDVLEHSLRLALENDLEFHISNAYSNLGSAAGEVYRFAMADHYLALGAAFDAEHDLDASGSYDRAWQALSHLYQGRWDGASETARAALDSRPLAVVSHIMALLALGRLRARRGDPEVWTALDQALELAMRTGTLQRLGPVRAARAEAAWLAGDAGKTREEARAAFDLALHKRHPWFVGELAYWRWKAGDLDEVPTAAARPFALQMKGAWREAAAAWTERNCPYEAARALAEGDDEVALKEALAAFVGLGAGPAAQRLSQRLHALGIRGVPRGPRPSTQANPAQLTRRQLEILLLLAEGLSNAEIAARLYRSPRTVAHHVSSLLAKLEARNRLDAVRKAADLGILPK